MGIKSRENSLSAWAFLFGVVLAIIVGLATSLFSIEAFEIYNAQIYAILAIIGIFIGITNVASKDLNTFMIAGVVLVIVARFGMDSVSGPFTGIGLGETVSSIFAALLALFVPATIVVALKAVFSIAKV
jgi:hypothetical protein